MSFFSPTKLSEIGKSLKEKYPLPDDYARSDISVSEDIIIKLKNNNKNILDLSFSELNYAFQIAQLCDENDFADLKSAVAYKASKHLLEIGFIFCQINYENKRASELFTIVCEKLEKSQPDFYSKTLMFKTRMPWSGAHTRAFEILRLENLSLEDFCLKYQVIINSQFYTNLKLLYLSKEEKPALLESEPFIIESIRTANPESLRPVIRSYSDKIPFEELSSEFKSAILKRLSAEKNDMVLGVSPVLLQKMRSEQYNHMLEDFLPADSNKLEVYKSISGRIKNIVAYENGFFAIFFDSYVVINLKSWTNHAFAFLVPTFEGLLKSWQNAGFPADYWPAVDERKIVSARNMFLTSNKSDVIELKFNDFDILYTKDVLTTSRF